MATIDFATGEIVPELLKDLMAVSRKSIMYKSAAKSLHAGISIIFPLIREIQLIEEPAAFYQIICQRFSEILSKGLHLADAALRSNRWNLYKNLTIARAMEKLGHEVLQFHPDLLIEEIHEHQQVLADIRNFRVAADGMFDRIEQATERIAERLSELRNEGGEGVGAGGRNWMMMEEDMRMQAETEVASVGMEMGKRKVKEMLIGRDDLSVVSVCGIAGSGKTTLVREICRDNDVLSHFNGKILLLTVSQSPNIEHLSSKIWEFVKGNSDLNPGSGNPEFNLNHEIIPSAQALLVLDDIWSQDDLEKLVLKLPGCKTLVVSRIKFTSVLNGAIHEMALLGEEDALTLFCLSAFGQTSIPQTANERLAKEIVSVCKGLPLALRVIGASLRDEPEMYWRSARKRLARGETIGESHERYLLERMAISVNHLSEKVRECFLDLGAFPRDKKIPFNVLINIWADLHHIDVEESYTILVELANKSLLTLTKDSRYEDAYCSCYDISVSQHDVLRDLTLHLSSHHRVNQRTRLLMPTRESELPEEWEKNSDHPFSARIVSIHTGEMNEMDWYQMDFPKAEVLILNFSSETFFMPPFMDNMPNLRALVIINDHSANATLSNFHEFLSLANLQSLWLEKVVVPQLSSAIVPLTKLRKLFLVLCQMKNSFDHSWQDLAPTFPSLLELTIDNCDDLFENPPSFCRMHHNFKRLPSDLGQVTESGIGIIEVIAKLDEMRVLGDSGLTAETSTAPCTCVNGFGHFKSPTPQARNSIEALNSESISTQLPLLQHLVLKGILLQLPEWIVHLQNLSTLCLSLSQLTEDPLIHLADLPNLESLFLFQAFDGDQLNFEEGGFKKLKSLYIKELHGLNVLEIKDHALPHLEEMRIGSIPLLNEVPSGFQYLRNLKVLASYDMPDNYVLSMLPNGGSDHWKVEHIPSVNFLYRVQGRNYKSFKLGDPDFLDHLLGSSSDRSYRVSKSGDDDEEEDVGEEENVGQPSFAANQSNIPWEVASVTSFTSTFFTDDIEY